MKKRIYLFVLAVALLLSPLSLASCSSKPPALEAVYDTVVELVERSYAANDLLYGYGLPVIAIGSQWAELNYVYRDSDYADYEYVSEHSRYLSVSAIKDALESVYSSEFLDNYLPSLFDGFVVGNDVIRARYYESDEWLYQSLEGEPLVTWQRIYDYSTMRMVKPSRADYITVEIDTHLEGDDTILPVKIAIVYENGAWKLDSATY